MAIAINPDVRELDFSDNVKVSKFMQDFSDFRAKKWITYRPVNAPSVSSPFMGGTRQFVINMGTGHILDTWYSGLWYTLKFANGSPEAIWPFSTSLPRTSAAWIESVTFMHSNVPGHIDERLTDYDAVSAIFVPAKDIKSMDQTFFHFDYSQCMDGNPFNAFAADDPYGKMFPCGIHTSQRLSYGTVSFFIPLCRLSTIFNSGKYFFPSLLRGNGEMTIMIRSVANSLNEVFGGDNCGFSAFASTNMNDRIYRTLNEGLSWAVCMEDMKLVTLNLDNAFLTKEYNAFIASGRKFIRSFKAYNYQFYQVKAGYNRIEIANTHQSISHIILAFQTNYSVRCNGRATDANSDIMLGNQKTTALPPHVMAATQAFHSPGGGGGGSSPQNLVRVSVSTPISKPKAGDASNHLNPFESHHFGTESAAPFITHLSELNNTLSPIESPVNQTLGQKILNSTTGFVNRLADAGKDASMAAIDALRNGKSLHEIAGNTMATFITSTMKPSVNRPAPNQSQAANVRSGSAKKQQRRGQSKLAQSAPPKQPTAEEEKQELLDNIHQSRLAVARNQESIDELTAWQIKNRVTTISRLISRAFPDFDWNTFGEKKIDNQEAFVLYIDNLLFGTSSAAKANNKHFKKLKAIFDVTSGLTTEQKDLLATLFGVQNTKMRALAGKYIAENLTTLNPATMAIVRHAFDLGRVVPSTPAEFNKFCEEAAVAYGMNVAETCAEIGITDEVHERGAAYDMDGSLKPDQLVSTAPADPGAGGQPGNRHDHSSMPLRSAARKVDTNRIAYSIVTAMMPAVPVVTVRQNGQDVSEPAFTALQADYLRRIMGSIIKGMMENARLTWHTYNNLLLPCEAKQIYDLGPNLIEKLQIYRGTGNGETVFSEPVNENMFYHISREAMGDSAEDHPFFSRKGFDRDCAYVVISLNTFMRDAHHEFWDGFSTNRVADRLYVEFENTYLRPSNLAAIPPWYYDLGYIDNTCNLNCKVFTIYDNIYYIDRNNNLNVSDTLLPLQEGRGPSTD